MNHGMQVLLLCASLCQCFTIIHSGWYTPPKKGLLEKYFQTFEKGSDVSGVFRVSVS